MKQNARKKLLIVYYKVLCVLLNPKKHGRNPYDGSPIKGWLTRLLSRKKKAAAWIFINGEVTRVGFRKWLRRKAEANGLKCQVRNRNPKTVEALLIGSGVKIEKVIRASWEGPKKARVKSIKEYWFNRPVRDGAGFSESQPSYPNKINIYKQTFSATKLIASEFKNLGYKPIFIGNYLVININGKKVVFLGSCSSLKSSVGVKISSNKVVTRKFFKNAGIKIAKGRYFNRNDKEKARAFALSMPSCVVKPTDQQGGRGITVGVKDSVKFDYAWDIAVKNTKKGVIVEEEFQGIDVRYLVVGGKCVAVTKRIPPYVIGNGINTVEELIEKKNQERLETPLFSKRLIKLDPHRLSIIRSQGLELSSIPAEGERVFIDWKANFCAGGEICDLTDEVHPLFKRVAEQVAASIPSLDVVGVDIMARDHSEKPNNNNYIIIEANTRPMILIHHYPMYGKPRNVAREIVEYILKVYSAHSNKQTISTNNHHLPPLNDGSAYDQNGLDVSGPKKQGVSERKGDYREKTADLSAKRLIVNEFEALGYSCEFIDEYTVVPIGDKKLYFSGTESSLTSFLGVKILKDKAIARKFFIKAGVSIAKGKYFARRDKETARKFALSLSPCVIQPSERRKGEEVTIEVKDPKEFDYAWDIAVKSSKKGILIEEAFSGVKARYLVVGGKCVAVLKLIPPRIIGNGIDTVEELINKKNQARSENPHLCNRLIGLDADSLKIIKRQGFDLTSIPSKGEEVLIDPKASLSTGADSYDVTEEVHPLFKKIAEKVATSIPGLDVVGVDIVAYDHTKEPNNNNYIVIGATARPPILNHHYPMYGKARNVAGAIVQNAVKSMR